MALTPIDILNKEFDTKFRGYDIDQVNDYLDVIVADYEDLLAKVKNLEKDLADAQDKIDYFSQLQESLNSSILVAQEAAERLKQNARKEAELILVESEREANKRLADASEAARQIVTEADVLKRSSTDYRQKLEEAIRQQLDFITSEEYKTLFNGDSLESSLKIEDFQLATEGITERVEELVQATELEVEAERDEITQATFNNRPLDSNNELDDFTVEYDLANFENDLTIQLPEDEDIDEPLGQTIRIELPSDDK